jgi:hypothetical protein
LALLVGEDLAGVGPGGAGGGLLRGLAGRQSEDRLERGQLRVGVADGRLTSDTVPGCRPGGPEHEGLAPSTGRNAARLR